MLAFVFILVFIKLPHFVLPMPQEKQRKKKTSQTHVHPTPISQPVGLSSVLMISRTDSPILSL